MGHIKYILIIILSNGYSHGHGHITIYIYMMLNVPYHVPSLDSDHGRVDKIGPSEMGKTMENSLDCGMVAKSFRSFRISRMDLDWASNIDRTRGWNGWNLFNGWMSGV